MLLIGSWNLKDGGIDGGSTHRLASQMGRAAALELDVLLVQEAKHWLASGARGLHLAERLLGMRGYLARAPRHDCNLVVFVRPGFVRRGSSVGIRVLRERHQEHAPFWHAQARVECAVDGLEQPLILASNHSAPFNPDLRISEAYVTTDLAAGPAIVGGDFNDPGLGDPPPAWSTLPGYKRVRHIALDSPDGEDRADTRAAQILEQAGFTDVAAHVAARTHRPDLLAPTAGFGATSTPVRSDRIYVSEPLQETITGYRLIEQDDSDHHLVVAEFDLAV